MISPSQFATMLGKALMDILALPHVHRVGSGACDGVHASFHSDSILFPTKLAKSIADAGQGLCIIGDE